MNQDEIVAIFALNPDSYTPEIVKDDDFSATVLIAVECDKCDGCGKPMVVLPFSLRKTPKQSYWSRKNAIQNQIERAGLVSYGEEFQGRDYCETCIVGAKATFTCIVCKKECSSDLYWDGYYSNSTEPRCINCYATVPAKEWDDLNQQIHERHKYDYE